MKPRARRGLAIAAGLAAIALATGLVLNAFRSNLVFFFSPSQIAAQEAPRDRSFRLGGLVLAGSLKRASGDLTVQFVVTDLARTIPVVYTGLLPDLFTEGKGVVAQGRLGPDGVFHADQVLAKHDENYMPPEARQALADARPGGGDPQMAGQKTVEQKTIPPQTSGSQTARTTAIGPRAIEARAGDARAVNANAIDLQAIDPKADPR